MKTLTRSLLVATLSAAMVSPSVAAIEVDDEHFGPTYDRMVVDTVVGKPLGLLAVVGGAAAWVASLPFTLFNGDAVRARQTLIDEPFYALNRCHGCTVAEDSYYKSQQDDQHNVRVVVDGPSEILINTNQNVVVNQP